MKYKLLDRNESLSTRGKKRTIEEIRQTVANNDKNIRVGDYYGAKRVGIYRNGIKVALVAIEEETTDDQIRDALKEALVGGTFDEQLTTVYGQIMQERKEKKAKKDEVQ